MSFEDQAFSLIARANATGDPSAIAAAEKVQESLGFSPWQIWPVTCAEAGRPSANTGSRVAFDFYCSAWSQEIRSRLVDLANALRDAGDPGGAEVALSIGDQADTMQEQSGDVLPSRENFQFPEWVKWAVGLIAANELLKAWERLRS